MSDLTERLRNVRVYGASLEGFVVQMGVNPIAIEAAAEITRLRTEAAEHAAELAMFADRSVDAWKERDYYLKSNVALAEEITRLQARVAELEAGDTHPDYDPTDDIRWVSGCNFAVTQLARSLGVPLDAFSWDAATETLDGDVTSVLWNVLYAAFGEDWEPPTREATEHD